MQKVHDCDLISWTFRYGVKLFLLSPANDKQVNLNTFLSNAPLYQGNVTSFIDGCVDVDLFNQCPYVLELIKEREKKSDLLFMTQLINIFPIFCFSYNTIWRYNFSWLCIIELNSEFEMWKLLFHQIKYSVKSINTTAEVLAVIWKCPVNFLEKHIVVCIKNDRKSSASTQCEWIMGKMVKLCLYLVIQRRWMLYSVMFYLHIGNRFCFDDAASSTVILLLL